MCKIRPELTRGKQSYYYRWTTTYHQRIVRRTTYDVAKDSWSHEVRQLGRLEDIDRTFGLQLASQRRQSAERSCRDSAHTEKKPPQIIKAVLILRGLLKCWPDCEGLTHRGPQWGRPLWRSPPSPGWGAQRCCWWDCLGSASGGRCSVSPPEQSRPVEMKKKDVCHEKSQTVSGPQISGLPLLPQILPLAEIWHRWGKKVHNF